MSRASVNGSDMRGNQTFRFAALALGMMVGLVTPARAQGIKPPPEPRDCAVMLEQFPQASIWWGRYAGSRQTMGWDEDIIQNTYQEACFPDRAACELWLYWMRSEWSYMERRSECLQGYHGPRRID